MLKIHPLVIITICSAALFLGMLQNHYRGLLFVISYLVLAVLLAGNLRKLLIPCLAMLALSLGVAGLTYLLARNPHAATLAALRIVLIFLCGMLTSTIDSADVSRCLDGLGVNKKITLGILITVNFLFIFVGEITRIIEAMKMRGVRISIFSGELFYRSIIIPTLIKMIGVSDTLALSIETRCFGALGHRASQLRKVPLRHVDVVVAGGFLLTVALMRLV